MASGETYDYIVIGSGLAGLTYALHAAEKGTVAVLTKGEAFESNTRWAQGGIAAAVGEADSWLLHEEDTLIAGAGLCDPTAVRFLVQNAPEAIQWLIGLGVAFDQAENGLLALGLEGGHSRNRIVHTGDQTGLSVENAVLKAVLANKGISVYERTFVTSLLMDEGVCVGARAHIDSLGVRNFFGGAVMLATGGCGRMYQHTTNPSVATGDGIALAASVGAEIKDLEFMQFHPTTLYHPQMRSALITEAVRGVGGTLRNHLGTRFMYNYDSRLELAPRDVVSRAIDSELKRLQTWCVYLDTTHLPEGLLRHEFPSIYAMLESIDIRMERDWIPVVPAQHYSCGGVVTDLSGRTSVPRLLASGEVARTGVHGANRLASNSLLEALVFSESAAKIEWPTPIPPKNPQSVGEVQAIAEADSVLIRRGLAKLMTQQAGIVRTKEGLEMAMAGIKNLTERYTRHPGAPFSMHPLETHNLLVGAEFVVRGALERKDNVGLHFLTTAT